LGNEERKYYSGYAVKMEQVSLAAGNPYLGVNPKKGTALVLRAGKGTPDLFLPLPIPRFFPLFSHYYLRHEEFFEGYGLFWVKEYCSHRLLGFRSGKSPPNGSVGKPWQGKGPQICSVPSLPNAACLSFLSAS